jgi:hypothetical protein
VELRPYRSAERQPCRGVNLLRPHPYGPHFSHACTLAVGHRSSVELRPSRSAERQPCRGVNLLRPHPYGPHISHACTLAVGHRSSVELRPYRSAERQPCRGVNLLRPHPYGPHIPHACLWPEAIAARWSCGPHVTPASNRRRRCRAGVSRPITYGHFGDVPPMLRPLFTLYFTACPP